MEYDNLQFCDWTLLLLMFSVHSYHLPLLCIRDNDVRGAISRQSPSGRGRQTALPSHSVTLWTLGTGLNTSLSPKQLFVKRRESSWPRPFVLEVESVTSPLAQRRPVS